MRTATGKTFLMQDGSYRIVDYGMTVHYQDGDGIWQEIDNTLLENTDSDGNGRQRHDISSRGGAVLSLRMHRGV